MQKGDYLKEILKSEKTVFTLKNIALLWRESNSELVKFRLNYYAKTGQLIRIRKGIYVKNMDYDKLELGSKIFTPSYISFETVLLREGLIFQFHSDIFLASYLTRSIEINGQIYNFRKIKKQILVDSSGILQDGNYSIACKERAFLDTLYLNKDYYFDNLNSVNWNKIFELLKIYNNKRMNKLVNKIYKNN